MPGSHDWRNRAASQIAQPLPDNTADAFTVINLRAVDRHMWSKGEYERALDLINRGYDKLIVAQIIDRTLAQLKSKLSYEQMEDGKRQQRRAMLPDDPRPRDLSGHAVKGLHRGSPRGACAGASGDPLDGGALESVAAGTSLDSACSLRLP